MVRVAPEERGPGTLGPDKQDERTQHSRLRTHDCRDGQLDAVLVDDGAAWLQFWRARRLTIGLRRRAQGIHRARVRTATIAAPRLVCHVDGEPFEIAGEAEVRLKPGALKVAGLEATER
jgi:diacylglycerol kinase family enzyme